MLAYRTTISLNRPAALAHPRNARFGIEGRVANVGLSELRIKL